MLLSTLVLLPAGLWLARDALMTLFMATWTVIYIACLAATVAVTKSFVAGREKKRPKSLVRWRAALISLETFQAALWGTYVFLVFPTLRPLDQVLATWIVLVLGAVAAVSMPISAASLRLYLLLSFAPAVASWLMLEQADGLFMGLFVALLVPLYEAIGRWHMREANARTLAAGEARHAYEQLEKENATRTRLIVEANHDLNQPVQALGRMLNQVDVEGPQEDLARHLLDVRASVHTISAMLSDMLDLSRLERGDYPVDLQPVSVGQLLQELDEVYSPLAQRQGLGWVIPRGSGWVRSDPVMLRRILGNILSNAIKFTPAGTVSISCRYKDDSIRILITDTGTGIPANKINSIFMERVRLDNARQVPGHGIGLAVVKQMTKLLRHDLKVGSEVNQGTSFSVKLKRADAIKEPVPEYEARVVMHRPWKGKMIVLILNDRQLCISTKEMLVFNGAKVIAGTNLEEALSEYATRWERPDLIITDMNLGTHTDGLGVISSLREEFQAATLQAILLADELSAVLGGEAKIAKIQLVQKPVTLPRLRELVASIIGRQKSVETLRVAELVDAGE